MPLGPLNIALSYASLSLVAPYCALSWCGFPALPRVALRIGFQMARSRDAIPRVAPRMPRNSESCSEHGLFTPRALFLFEVGVVFGLLVSGCHSEPTYAEEIHHLMQPFRHEKTAQRGTFSGWISRGHPGVIRADIPDQQFPAGPRNLGKPSNWAEKPGADFSFPNLAESWEGIATASSENTQPLA